MIIAPFLTLSSREDKNGTVAHRVAKLHHETESRGARGAEGRGEGEQREIGSSVPVSSGDSKRYSQRAAEGIEESVEVLGRRHNFAGSLDSATNPVVSSLALSDDLGVADGTFRSLARSLAAE